MKSYSVAYKTHQGQYAITNVIVKGYPRISDYGVLTFKDQANDIICSFAPGEWTQLKEWKEIDRNS